MIYKRFVLLAGVITFALILLVIRSGGDLSSSGRPLRNLPQRTATAKYALQKANSEEVDDLGGISPGIRVADNDLVTTAQGTLVDSAKHKTFRPGRTKPPGSQYTKGIIIGRLQAENVSWLQDGSLPDGINAYTYVVDDPYGSEGLKLPKNKGHEAMVYLTYIIDHYDRLDDVSIFLHAHKMAWHNNELLNHDATEMIKRLSAERVLREGYMNLRCHWKPGCPRWLHPHSTGPPDVDRPEERPMAGVWAELFPSDPVPESIATPCCAQFALSRDRIRQIPLTEYRRYRDWLLKTKLPDSTSGRVFEYLWGKMFTGYSTFCPDQRICYCDGFGVCFESEKEFDYWFELRYLRSQKAKQLSAWQSKAQLLTQVRSGRGILEIKQVEVPLVDEDVRLQDDIDRLDRQLEDRRLIALQKGTDPRVRARIAGRPWKEGDGF